MHDSSPSAASLSSPSSASLAQPAPARIERGGASIAFEVLPGNDAAASKRLPLVLVHGFGASRAGLRRLAHGLLGAGRHARALSPDLRGHGETHIGKGGEGGEFTYAAMRDDLLALLAAECPNGADVVGHSMGGQIALEAAIARPTAIRSLTTLGAGPCRAVAEDRERRSWERAASFFAAAEPAALVRALADAAPADAVGHPELAPERLYANARGEDLARVIRGGFLHVETNDEACRRLAVPTLVLVGEADTGWLEPSRKLASLVPSARLVVIPGGGHHVHVEQEQSSVRAITDFWTSLEHERERR